MDNTTIRSRLSALKNYMEQNHLDAFIIPSTDAHLSEYPASHWESRQWISGFTGSAGTVVVTRQKSGLWTDSRYFLQATTQLEGTTIDLYKEGLPKTPSITEWLATELKPGATVGIDAQVYSAKEAIALEKDLARKGLKLSIDKDPFAYIWNDRPAIPTNPIFILPEEYTGESAKSKINRINEVLKREGANSLLIGSLDTIAWLYNLRGNDVKCNPVAVCFAYVSKKESILFIDPRKVTPEAIAYFKSQNIILADYDKVFDYVSKLKETVCVDSSKITLKLLNTINKENKIVDIASPADLMKACKNETELEGFRNAMLKDGVALVRFYMWLEANVKSGKIKETDIAKKLIEFRAEQDLFVGESFDTIAGYGANGAIVHYHAEEDTASYIKPEGLLLIDSGGQYMDGTTDITRTIAVGELTQQMKDDYTLVLKGHINLANAIFPEGTRGSQLDILARKYLWDRGLNFLHGTGHGIGHFLNVHEGPQNIRMNENPTTLQIGMVTSNEPGLYRDGKYGIRLENLIVTQHEMTGDFGDFYSFETITLCPWDTTPINKALLTTAEIEWINAYHKDVYNKLSPLLNEEENKWLKNKTHEI